VPGNRHPYCDLVEYPGGRKEVASAAPGDGRIAAGQKVLTVVRPESDLVRGRIEKMVYLGPTAEYELGVEDQKRPLAAVVANPIEAGFFEIGEEVSVDFNPQAAHLLPA